MWSQRTLSLWSALTARTEDSSRAPPMEGSTLLGSETVVPANARLPKVMPALHMPRLLGAIHIVFFHMTHYVTFASAGNSWVTFFFMLSAFGATHSQVASVGLRETAESAPWFPDPLKLLRRWISVYPTYLVAFLLAWLGRCLIMRGLKSSCFHPAQLIVEGLMLTGWFPVYGVTSTIGQHFYNTPGWYVSALAVLWFFEGAVIRLAAKACVQAGPGRIPWYALACTLIWVLCLPFASFPYTWGVRQPQTAITVIPPMQNLHVYFLGSLLACWMHGRADVGLMPFRFAATISSLVLVAFFFFDVKWLGTDPETLMANKAIILRLRSGTGALIPVFAALLAGLAGGVDPLAVGLGMLPQVVNDAARELATGVYLLQEPVCLLFTTIVMLGKFQAIEGTWVPFGGLPFFGVYLLAYFAVLFVVSALVQYAVQKPLAKFLLAQLPPSNSNSSSRSSSSPAGERSAVATK